MTFGAQRQREDASASPLVERYPCCRSQFPTDKKCRWSYSLVLQVVAFSAPAGLPRKVMVVGYFAESKGVVGCEYRRRRESKVRGLYRFLILILRAFYDPQAGRWEH
jgi:hypothetical protein